MSKRISRSTFLLAGTGTVAAAIVGKLAFEQIPRRALPPCRMLGPAMTLGHKVRDGQVQAPVDGALNSRVKTVIVGGGIAGLSAAWWLKRNGFDDFVVLELEDHVGGNSASGSNTISAYPWGAHYVPLANSESEYVRILFRELGVIQGTDANGQPIYNELYICHDPQERLYKDGSFEEGLVPRKGLQPEDKAQLARFFEIVKEFRAAKGLDGKPAFAIPVDLSSSDQRFLRLDTITMSDWMREQRLTSRPLLWYVNYCCRDDYGSDIANVSAWAGLHYFAGRRGTAANAEANSVVTWPQGNGFLVEKLRDGVQDHIRTGVAASRVANTGESVVVGCFDQVKNCCFKLTAENVIFCAPRFIAKHVVVTDERSQLPCPRSYAPWMVANISLKHPPRGEGAALAWDNVRYNSDSLGYVVATHQNITTRQGQTVITYYLPLSKLDPKSARASLSSARADTWGRLILDDLEEMHPGITADVIAIDLWPWGHGMVQPSPGFIWSDLRRRMKESVGRIHFAHSDMSGISNFEEAQYHGVEAARKVLSSIPGGYRS